jgi:hypothetical protein
MIYCSWEVFETVTEGSASLRNNTIGSIYFYSLKLLFTLAPNTIIYLLLPLPLVVLLVLLLILLLLLLVVVLLLRVLVTTNSKYHNYSTISISIINI